MPVSRLLHPGHRDLAAQRWASDGRSAVDGLLALVAQAPPGPAREQVRAAIARAGATILDRTARPGHLTGSALVVRAAGDATLLLLHAKLGKWLQPGGHADGDANLVHVAWREAVEETGITDLAIWPVPIDVDVHEVRPPADDPHLHLDMRFLVVAPTGVTPVRNHESRALRWVPWADLEALDADPGLLRLASRGRLDLSAILAEDERRRTAGD